MIQSLYNTCFKVIEIFNLFQSDLNQVWYRPKKDRKKRKEKTKRIDTKRKKDERKKRKK